jgi:hypothetical protein
MNKKHFSDRELHYMFSITANKLMEMIRICYKTQAYFDVPRRYI